MARSSLRLWRYRLLFSGLTLGKNIRIGPGATLRVLRGASLIIGDGVTIEANCELEADGELIIGSRSFIGAGTVIVAVERIAIGADALIAAYATIRDQDHRIDDDALPYNRQGLITAPIEIADNVWIGTKATVLKGVHIGRGAIIGAHALVRTDVEAGSMVGGVPARRLKSSR